ncbi:uncharacterized protein DNG_08906 [Cephalotrichum gorgonifer]|uniref:Uncharacterized protein n=1 Tax=Cephalotrichum gorgonifer TaxID=2041049 RepID=A0AAE8N4Y5_9PEZI|nr:uncharacterized protein DNG_08906 [Cephalotrichum gorgonifer]
MFNKLSTGLSSLLVLSLAAAFTAADDPECSDLSSPQCCYDAFMSWTSSKANFEAPTETVVDYTDIYTNDVYTNVPTTTLCDGFLRYLGPQEGEVYTTRVSADEPVTTWLSTPYPTPAPSCTIGEEDCIPFMQAYRSSSEAYRTNNSNPYPTMPPCTTYSTCPKDGGYCKMWATAHTAWYWPVTLEGDFCGDRTTITHPEPTRSTVISGTTFVSPSVYISIERLRANSHLGQYTLTPCGRDKTSVLLSLHPTDVSTHFGPIKRYSSTFKQLNLADMNDPTPVTAYFGLTEAPDCTATPESCTATIDVSHTPLLSAPVQMFRDLDPDYESCNLHPSAHDRIGPITWIPLEPTQDSWPTPTTTSED